MAFFNEFPHTRTYDSDLGWLIVEMKKLLVKWGNLEKAWEEFQKKFDDNLDQTVKDQLTEWLKDGTLEYLIEDVIESFPWISVTDFGAKGDGITDDTIAFRNAASALYNSNKTILFVPNGTYIVNNFLISESNIHLMGAGPSSVLRGIGNGAHNPSKKLYNVKISNLAFDGGNGSSGTALTTLNIENLYIDNVQVYNSFDGLSLGTIEYCFISNIHIYDIENNGITVNFGSTMQIYNSKIYNTLNEDGEKRGVGIYLTSGNLWVISCDIVNWNKGLYVVNTTALQIYSTAIDTNVTGLDASNGHDIELFNVRLGDNNQHLQISSSCQNISLNSCVFIFRNLGSINSNESIINNCNFLSFSDGITSIGKNVILTNSTFNNLFGNINNTANSAINFTSTTSQIKNNIFIGYGESSVIGGTKTDNIFLEH